MSLKLSKEAYQTIMIDKEIKMLEELFPKDSLEKKHIIDVLNWSVKQLYPETEFKDITTDKPTNDDIGKEFLCIIKECDMFQRYELCEWWSPLCDDETPMDDSEMPSFSIENKTCGQQSLSREVTHWAELPKLPYRIKYT